MAFWSKMTRFFIISLAVSLAACVSPTSPKNTGSSRYEMADDSPVLEPIDLTTVEPVIPLAVDRTIAGNKSPYTVNGKTYLVMESEAGYEETGLASWYGRKFHGHLTSNGEIYDMFSLSAAHKSLPIPSFLEITNLDNGKSVVVRVNDRGPFHDERIVDLSYAAAASLNYAAQGTARVRVRALLPELSRLATLKQNNFLTENSAVTELQEKVQDERELIEQGSGQEFLQIGAFSNLDSARQILVSVKKFTSLPVFIRSDENLSTGGLLHRVRLGPVNETIDLQSLVRIFIDAGLGAPFRVRQ